MEPRRRKQLLLVALVAVLGALISVLYSGQRVTSEPPTASSNRTGATRTQASAGAAETPDVHLEALFEDRTKPVSTERNLFRFKPKPAPPPPPPPSVGVTVPGAVAPSGPPPLPPIPYKFIGLVEVPGQKKRIAVLSDGRSSPLYGREGDIIEGRYRIVRIGAESIELEYIDGRGRQTIRLSGS